MSKKVKGILVSFGVFVIGSFIAIAGYLAAANDNKTDNIIKKAYEIERESGMGNVIRHLKSKEDQLNTLSLESLASDFKTVKKELELSKTFSKSVCYSIAGEVLRLRKADSFKNKEEYARAYPNFLYSSCVK